MTFASTPLPPYFAVIITSQRTEGDHGYAEMAEAMVNFVARQPGFLGIESAREDLGITVSYWQSLEAIALLGSAAYDHLVAQRQGHAGWYQSYKVRIGRVERDYSFEKG